MLVRNRKEYIIYFISVAEVNNFYSSKARTSCESIRKLIFGFAAFGVFVVEFERCNIKVLHAPFPSHIKIVRTDNTILLAVNTEMNLGVIYPFPSLLFRLYQYIDKPIFHLG